VAGGNAQQLLLPAGGRGRRGVVGAHRRCAGRLPHLWLSPGQRGARPAGGGRQSQTGVAGHGRERFVAADGVSAVTTVESKTNAFAGDLGSQCFAMAIDLETSNGVEISGLNAEEQSDIALIANWKSNQQSGATQSLNGNTITGGVPTALEVYSYYDAMIVLRENNVLELIQ